MLQQPIHNPEPKATTLVLETTFHNVFHRPLNDKNCLQYFEKLGHLGAINCDFTFYKSYRWFGLIWGQNYELIWEKIKD